MSVHARFMNGPLPASRHALIARRSRVVKVLRIGVSLSIAMGIAAFITHYGQHNDFTPPAMVKKNSPLIELENRLVGATLMSKDAKGQPIIIKAGQAIQRKGHAFLEQPESQVNLEEGKTVTIQSHQATYDEGKKTLVYEKDVKLQADGLCFTTQEATVNLENNVAGGRSPVAGSGPQGSIQAQGGFDWKEKTLSLRGPSKIIFN